MGGLGRVVSADAILGCVSTGPGACWVVPGSLNQLATPGTSILPQTHRASHRLSSDIYGGSWSYDDTVRSLTNAWILHVHWPSI